jgi:hypothetical protein
MSFTLKLTLFAGACLVTTEAMAVNIGVGLTPSFRPDGSPCYFTDCNAPASGSRQSIQEGKREQSAKRPPRHQRYRQQ